MGYSRPTDHRGMLFDSKRNAAYYRALKQVVTPESTVMDLGAGLGVHGLMAAQLGAKRVVLVEPTSVVEIAREAAQSNGLAQVECARTRIEDFQTDERFDVIVSVLAGNFLLSEDLLSYALFARDRFLAPGGCLLPDAGTMQVVPVAVPKLYNQTVASWGHSQETSVEQGIPGLDYGVMTPYAANYPYPVRAEHLRADYLADPVCLLELDFYTATEASCYEQIEIEIRYDGVCHGWLGWSTLRLGEEWLSTEGKQYETHWSQVFMPLLRPLHVKRGDCLRFELKHPAGGDWSWTTRFGDDIQRQSTFLSKPVSLDAARKKSEAYKPALNQKGEAAQWLLAQCNGEHTVQQLAVQLRERYANEFADDAVAIRFVRGLMGSLS